MCGIVGIVSSEALPPDVPIDGMRDALAARGPDDRGTWWSEDRRVAFGHRRLSVIDLSPGAAQPMRSASGRTAIVFNGEIYNYRELRAQLEARGARFRTASDTEVILEGYEAWGDGVLPRLDGMFALALADPGRRRVLLARDRAGQKPLFLVRVGQRLLFGSEIKALLGHPDVPRRLDRESLDFYLAYGYAPAPRCLLEGFRKLRPAHAMGVSVDSLDEREWSYWQLPEAPALADRRAASGSGARAACLNEFETRLEQAVARQMVADVPVGVLLSGGLDSSLVTAMAVRRSHGRVRTFTVTFPGHPSHDEGPHARLVASHLGTEHTELAAEGAGAEHLVELARQFDEPVADSAIVPTWLLSRLVRREVTVALGGDGSDELFGGYPHYRWLMRLARLKCVVPGPLRAALAAPASHLPVGVTGRHHLIGLAGDIGRSIAHVNMYFDRSARQALVPGLGLAGANQPEAWRGSLASAEPDLLARAMKADFQSTLPDAYLARVDRASMRWALEIRAPYLDHALVEFAMGRVPSDLKVTATERKVLPRALAARVLPPAFDRARKQGFTMPLGTWFAGGFGDVVADVLHAERDLFDRAAVDRLLAGQRAGRANAERLFALTMLALWRREYGVGV
ncbi:MAG TPA: asparagine synthase (glutamine-hydrolyzing) [Vicinamibacterales bacterium]|nr:asparagine synthase (glutamine-hydrolyzing) [Vicinamibacterales bacterium]